MQQGIQGQPFRGVLHQLHLSSKGVRCSKIVQLISSNAHSESNFPWYIYIYILTRVLHITLVGLWLPIGLDSCALL